MVDIEFPRSLEVDVRFVDRYTVRDLVRMTVCSAIGWFVGLGLGLVLGFLIGLIFTEITFSGKHVEDHLINYARNTVEVVTTSRPALKKCNEATAVLTDGTVIGIVRVSSCDLEMVSEAAQRANQRTLQEMLADLEDCVEIHSRQESVDLSEYPGSSDSATTTTHYIVVRESPSTDSWLPIRSKASPTTVDERQQRVTKRCTKIRNKMTGGDLSASRLRGRAFKRALVQFHVGDASLSRRQYEVDRDGKPFHRLLYIEEYPDQLPVGWLADIQNVETDGHVDIVQVADPISESQRAWIDRMIARIRAELEISHRPLRQARLEQKHRAATSIAEAEARGESLLNYGVYIIVRGETPTEAAETLDTVLRSGVHPSFEIIEPLWRTEQSLTAESLFCRDRLDETQIVPARSAAAGFPFAAYDTIETGGVPVGEDLRNEMAVVLDRFEWEAGHLTVMGKTGAGKTVWTQLMLLRSAQMYDDFEIYILDPKRRDYGSVTTALGGETVLLDDTDLSTTDPGTVTRYTVDDPTRDNTDLLIDAVRHIYREASKTESKSLVVVDEAHRLITDGNRINQDGLEAVSELIRQSRDRSIGATLVTQNADEFTRSREGKNILRNVDCNLFFKHQEVDNEVTDFFNFSEEESMQLRKLRTGTDLLFSEALIRGPVNTRLRIKATDAENTVIDDGSGPGFGSNESSSDYSQVSPSPDVTHPSSGMETDGGHSTKKAETTNSDSNGERYRLATVLSLTFAGPIGLFEYGLAAGILASAFLFLTGNLQPFLPIDIFPPQMVLFTNILPVIMTVGIIWVVVLSLYRWIAQ